MQQQNYQKLDIAKLHDLHIATLSKYWSQAWKLKPHRNISREMLIDSLALKIREARGQGLSHDQQEKLNQLVNAYKRNKEEGSQRKLSLGAGTQLIRDWGGTRHMVIVRKDGYEYKEKLYKSLSAVASDITGTRWNGWVFFGIKKSSNQGSAS